MERNETIRTVERAKTGDKRAFALLYRENYDKIYRYVLKNVGRPDAARISHRKSFYSRCRT